MVKLHWGFSVLPIWPLAAWAPWDLTLFPGSSRTGTCSFIIRKRDLHGGQTRAQSTPISGSLVACITPFLRGIESGERLVTWNNTVTPHFTFWWMGGTRLGTQQCRVSHAHMTEIGRDTNEAFRVFSDHPVIWYKNHRGNSSSLLELGSENTQALTFNEHTLAQACCSWI